MEVADNLKQVVEYQVQSFEPNEEERFCYDFALLRSPKNSKRLAVLLVMVKKSVLEAPLDRLRELGIKPVAVTCGSLGLINLFVSHRKELEGKTYLRGRPDTIGARTVRGAKRSAGIHTPLGPGG